MHAEEDRKKRELAEAKNNADAIIYTAQKTLKEFQDKIKEEDKKNIEEKIESLKKLKESDNIEDIKRGIQELSETMQRIGAELYKSQGSSGSSQEDSSQDEGGPKEGEYKEK